ncbi:hypothetical protein HY410_01285 [Candidatus Gottesmanbacteria bacterium]|nr:hypothetical protein [Candidatus Gottesmanbacteria bacterium]
MNERLVSIDPNKRGEHLSIVDKRFRQWHLNDWVLVYPSYDDFHDKIANASFTAYLEYFLNAARDNGQIPISELELQLRERLGEYFSPHKFENAVNFFEAGDWDALKERP